MKLTIGVLLIAVLGLPVSVTAAGAANGDAHDRAATLAHGAQADAYEKIARSHDDIRATELIGRRVSSADGQDLGTLDDLVVDAVKGTVQYAVVSFGDRSGLGGKLFAYPLERFRMDRGRGKLMLNVPKAQLERAPGVERGPDSSQPGYASRVERSPGAASARYVRASEMLQGEVRDRSGKAIGAVQDLVVDMRGSRVGYVVVAFDRPWSTGDKLVAMPMRAFRSAGGSLVYIATPEQLEVAPSFDRAGWPDIGKEQRFRDEASGSERTQREHDTDANRAMGR